MAVTTTPQAPEARGRGLSEAPARIGGGLLDPRMLWKSTPDAFKKLDPRVQIRNPVNSSQVERRPFAAAC
jgi:potassium-transporting ATPase ATP-binding subunit